jgi:glycosyltransferase involved in cell wall biosynthesis
MKPRLLFISGRETDYMRNRVLLAALRTFSDVTVLTSRDASASSSLATAGRSLFGLVRYMASRPDHDVCFAGFFGQMIAIGLSGLQRKPIILDAFVSAYDTLCDDRRRFGSNSIAGRLAFWLDQLGCRVSRHVITDTCADARYFQRTFDVNPLRLSAVYVGCDETIFYPRPQERVTGPPACEVFYYGAFLPLHGTEMIVQAAARLRHRLDIRWRIGGDGPGLPYVRQMVSEQGLTNLDFAGWIPVERLPDCIASADICLGGHFSTIPKAARVISTKTFQFLAMRKAVIVGDNQATREVLMPGRHVLAVQMGDPAALAEAVETLADNPSLRHRMAGEGYELYRENFTTAAIAEQLAGILIRTQDASHS